MFLTKFLSLSVAVYLFVVWEPAFAATQWVRMVDGDRRCSMTCGRAGLDNVISGQTTTLGESVCVGSGDEAKLYPGVQKLTLGSDCQIASAAASTAATKYCLCSHDGSPGGSDVIWADAIATSRCDTTCRAQGVTKYGYAVYTSYVNQSWTHVCMSGDGSIGFTGGGRSGCHTTTGAAAKGFKCLCTRGFSGDLEPGFNP